MTFKEKLMADRPDLADDDVSLFIFGKCPTHVGYVGGDVHSCVKGSFPECCYECWNQEIPETNDIPIHPLTSEEKETLKSMSGLSDDNVVGRVENVTVTNDGVRATIATAATRAGETALKMAEAGEKLVMAIKDSGDRTQFETGAVRDMREGKGRCDLMPLEVISKCWLHRAEGDKDTEAEAKVLYYINGFQKTRETSYLVKALDYFPAYEGWSTMFLEVAKHFEEGAKKYGENNWQKGIPVHCYIDSAVRHYLKWLRGDKDEPHDRAFVWNIMCCIWEVDYHKEEK
jgi:hypothetical protein